MITTQTEIVKDLNNKKEVLEALSNFSCDNPNEYSDLMYTNKLWEFAKQAGFKSNQEYVLDELSKKKKCYGVALISEFFNNWLNWDDSIEYSFEVGSINLMESNAHYISLAIHYYEP